MAATATMSAMTTTSLIDLVRMRLLAGDVNLDALLRGYMAAVMDTTHRYVSSGDFKLYDSSILKRYITFQEIFSPRDEPHPNRFSIWCYKGDDIRISLSFNSPREAKKFSEAIKVEFDTSYSEDSFTHNLSDARFVWKYLFEHYVLESTWIGEINKVLGLK